MKTALLYLLLALVATYFIGSFINSTIRTVQAVQQQHNANIEQALRDAGV